MKENRSHIVLNEPLAFDAWRLRFAVDWSEYQPGQFVMVGIPGNAVFLRRPFGIAGLEQGVAEICYKIVGRGTTALTQARVGDPISITGPCGRGFEMPTPGQVAMLVAGGYGIGPILGLARKLVAAQHEVHLYYGAKTSKDLLYRSELAQCGAKVVLTTDDGSEGVKGFVTERLSQDLALKKTPALFACGPDGMLHAVAKLALANTIPAQVSTEAYMACGIGVCNGCVCTAHDGRFVRTCCEGPVFWVEQLKWEA